jgi:cyclin G-associated kinase
MSDLFKSAIGYFSSSNTSGAENELIGQTVEVGNVKLRVKKVIAEGKGRGSILPLTFVTCIN